MLRLDPLCTLIRSIIPLNNLYLVFSSRLLPVAKMRIASLILLSITRLPPWAKIRIASLVHVYVVKPCVNAGPAPLVRVTRSIWMDCHAMVPACVSGDKELAHIGGGWYVCVC
jgi:hypothetical protein